MLKEEIYYADKSILNTIKNDFELLDDKDWYQLYQNKDDKSYWRLDKWDKYQEQFFVHLKTPDNWTDFDSKPLIMELLRQSSGISDSICGWRNCDKFSIKGLAFCEKHAYEEMGIRR